MTLQTPARREAVRAQHSTSRRVLAFIVTLTIVAGAAGYCGYELVTASAHEGNNAIWFCIGLFLAGMTAQIMLDRGLGPNRVHVKLTKVEPPESVGP